MKIKGFYIIECGNRVHYGENLITLLGESFFLNRAINSQLNPIQYIVLGNSSIKAKKTDTNLGNETVRKQCTRTVDLDKKQIILSCDCTATEVENTSEIGVHTGEILVSHDIYELEAGFIDESMDNVRITYIIQLNSLSKRTDFKYYTSADTQSTQYNIYYTTEPNTVIGVNEDNTHSGYHNVDSIDTLKTSNGAYYYDYNNQTLFIRTTGANNPNKYDISIQTE